MPIKPCPRCGELTSRRLDMPVNALVNYYRCATCGHVWTTDPKTDEVVTHITPLIPPKH